MFQWFKPKKSGPQILQDLLTHNAMIISASEGKAQAESEYLAICLILDDLTARKSREGYQDMIRLVQQNYPQHFNDVITYVGWTTGALKLKPEADAAMRARHCK